MPKLCDTLSGTNVFWDTREYSALSGPNPHTRPAFPGYAAYALVISTAYKTFLSTLLTKYLYDYRYGPLNLVGGLS